MDTQDREQPTSNDTASSAPEAGDTASANPPTAAAPAPDDVGMTENAAPSTSDSAAQPPAPEASEPASVADAPANSASGPSDDANGQSVELSQVESVAPGATPFSPPSFAETSPGDELASLELLDDVELDVKVELGRAEMYIEDVLRLGVGSVLELNKLAGDPVDIFVNERLVARGEVLVLNDSFCVRVNDIVSPVPTPEDSR